MPAVAKGTTYSLRVAPFGQVIGEAPGVRRPTDARSGRPHRGLVTVDQWMAIRQAYYSDRRSLGEVARLARVSRRKVRRVLWPLQSD